MADKPRKDDPRFKTEIETKTVVEDRTEAPEMRPVMEYHSEDKELDGGTVLTTFMEPVGGFPGEAEASE